MSNKAQLLNYLREFNDYQLEAMLVNKEHKPKVYRKLLAKAKGEPTSDKYPNGMLDIVKDKKK